MILRDTIFLIVALAGLAGVLYTLFVQNDAGAGISITLVFGLLGTMVAVDAHDKFLTIALASIFLFALTWIGGYGLNRIRFPGESKEADSES